MSARKLTKDILCSVKGRHELDRGEERPAAINADSAEEDDAREVFSVQRDWQGTFSFCYIPGANYKKNLKIILRCDNNLR